MRAGMSKFEATLCANCADLVLKSAERGVESTDVCQRASLPNGQSRCLRNNGR